MSDKNKTEEITYQLFSLEFQPYKNDIDNTSSKNILMDVINFVFEELNQGRGHLIDKNKNTQSAARELFMTSSVIMARERRIRCSIALIRGGRKPKIKPKEKYPLVDIKHLGEFAEETHFYIDFSKGKIIICCEYNHHGPRINDIEYYLRSIARYKLHKSKKTSLHAFMDLNIDDILNSLKDVLSMEFKIKPSGFTQMDKALVGKYFLGINNLGNLLQPRQLKVQALFTTDDNVTSQSLDKPKNTMFKDILGVFKKDSINIDCFENVMVKYEDKEGQEKVFNLMKGKKEFVLAADISQIHKKRQLYELVEKEFDAFIQGL